MSLNNYLDNVRKLQRLLVPDYVRQMQEVTRKFRMDNPLLDYQVELKKMYSPLNEVLYNSSLNSPLHEIARQLNSNPGFLRIFEYNFEDFIDDDVDEKQIVSIVDDTKQIIKNIYKDHSLLDIVEPRKFEEIIAELLYSKGFEVSLTKQTRDGGYDIIALQKIGGFPVKFLVECKRHKKNIGIDVIRSFCDVVRTENANKGIIFTTSYFSRDSIKKQNELGTILDFKNREDIINWIIDYNSF